MVHTLTCLTTDNSGIMYACVFVGIYVVNKHVQRFDKIGNTDDPFGITCDRNNNLIYNVYSDVNSVYILKPNDLLSKNAYITS